MSRTSVIALAVVLVILGGGQGLAQESAGVAGIVTDESKAVLPGVTVTATESGSGREYVAVTDDRGEYRLVNVMAGTYKITAELAGFATAVLSELELLVGRRANVPVVMKLATVEESVTVTGEAPLVDTQSTQVAGNIDRRQMEELPIPGRNWMELSSLVKGVISNDLSRQTPSARDDQYQLNLDGQQVKQNIAGASSFGQTGLSREAVAEFQIATSLFDVTQGRSLGVSIQAITRSGTNELAGSLYGYFRSDKFNAADAVAGYVLPFENQQAGGSLGGPIVQNRVHYFATYEYEREPNTFVLRPAGYTQSLSLPTKRIHHSLLARGDYQVSQKDHVSVRYTKFIDDAPFANLTGSSHPTVARAQDQGNWGVAGTWSRVLSASMVQEVKAGYYIYTLRHVPPEGVPVSLPTFSFSGVSIGAPQAIPEEFWQDSPSVRYDLNWHKGSHDFKIGGDLVKEEVTGNWPRGIRGTMTFSALPADIERRFPLDAWNDSSRWDLSGLDATALQIEKAFAASGPGIKGVREGTCSEWIPNYNGCGNWTLDVPRPQIAFWINDTWRVGRRLTLNLGIRYDLDWGASAPPLVNETDVIINNGLFTENVGYRNEIRDLNNWSPRVGFNYDVRGDGRLAIRGGSGLYYGVPNDNMTFNAQILTGQRILFSTFTNDGRPGWVLDPTRGITNEDVVSGRVPLPPQAVTVFAHDYQLPSLSSTMIGFQKQLGAVMAIDSDLVYERGWNMGSTRDPNLFFDPVTGYNRHPTRIGRPRPDYGAISLWESQGRSEALQLASSFTRRYRDNFQAGLVYTLVLFRNDTGVGASGYSGSCDNPFDLSLDSCFGRAADFQRHTLRLNGLYRLPADTTVAWTYFYGSGNYYQSAFGTNTFGSGAGRRLRPDGSLVPIRDFAGQPLHRVDLRLSKDIRLPGGATLTGTAELFNVLNHKNYGGYNTVLGVANYGQPTQQTGTAYRPRSGQLGVKVSF